jgi:hypothetical protein
MGSQFWIGIAKGFGISVSTVTITLFMIVSTAHPGVNLSSFAWLGWYYALLLFILWGNVTLILDEIVQTDFCYRLIHDKSPTLTANIDAWKVDLPNLTPSTGVDEDFTSAIQFLVSSRVTFALTEFFHIMGDFDDTHDAGLVTKVEDICLQIDDLYNEWKIVSIHCLLCKCRDVNDS